jgi:hypothetical protein
MRNRIQAPNSTSTEKSNAPTEAQNFSHAHPGAVQPAGEQHRHMNMRKTLSLKLEGGLFWCLLELQLQVGNTKRP